MRAGHGDKVSRVGDGPGPGQGVSTPTPAPAGCSDSSRRGPGVARVSALITVEQRERLKQVAKARGTTVCALLRQAVEEWASRE